MVEKTRKRTEINERRSEPRFALSLRLRLLGVDERNIVFGEHTYSQYISRHGICFTTSTRIRPGSPLSVRIADIPESPQSFLFEIRWRNEQGGRCVYGASVDDEDDWSEALTAIGISLEIKG